MTITGVAAGVPFTALAPEHGGPAPLVVTWHMLDAPRSDAAFAAALPMAGLPAWRVHLGLPLCGSRMVDGSMDAVVDVARSDALRAFADGLTRQALAEFPAALAELRTTFPVTDAPLGLVGGSLGGLIALRVLTAGVAPVGAVALVNPLIRARTLVPMLDATYPWDVATNALADELDFVARAAEITVPMLVVSGEEDHAQFRVDAADLSAAAPSVELRAVPGLAHPLAEEPGIEPAPQGELAKVVDDALTSWFSHQLARR
jgi:alpha-beta hydrolase superfamily lysophospholipase